MANANIAAERFDHWIRTSFIEMNTALENAYFAQGDAVARANISGIGEDTKSNLLDEGCGFVTALWQEGNTGAGFDSAFNVLGNVGLYMAALRRHEMTNPDIDTRSPFLEASSLALDVGTAIGMAPRFATAHLTTHNPAINGVRKSFTSLKDEFLFIDENARSILHLQRAADALDRIFALGVSNPVADIQFRAAADALEAAAKVSIVLFDNLDTDRFFHCVRPYYKPHHVGRQVYRGANAGDFAGINQLDLSLGLCRSNDPYYAQLLVDKMPYMLPAERVKLRETMRHGNLLDDFLNLADHAMTDWFQTNAKAYLDACDHFAAFADHHQAQLIEKYIIAPAADLKEEQKTGLTASGPPLEVLIAALGKLRDFRVAAKRDDIATRHDDLARLRQLVGRA